MLWTPPSQLWEQFDAAAINQARQNCIGENFIIVKSKSVSNSNLNVFVCFSSAATPQDELKAALLAHLHFRVDQLDFHLLRGIVDRVFPVFLQTLTTNDWKVNMPKLRPRNAKVFDIM